MHIDNMNLLNQHFRKCHSIVSQTIAKQSSTTPKPFNSIPGPRSLPILGSLLNYIPPFGPYRFNRLHHMGKLKYEKYGKVVREEIVPGVNLLFLFDPDDIETLFKVEGKNPCRLSHLALQKYRIVDTPDEHTSAGLLPTNGEEWGILRRTFQKALALENVRSLTPALVSVVHELIERIRYNRASVFSAQQDFLPNLMNLALELVGISFFGIKMREDKDLSYSLEEIVDAAMKINSLTLEMEKGLRLWRWFDTPQYRIIKNNTKLLESIAKRYVKLHLDGDRKLISTPACIVKHWLEDSQYDIKNIITMSADMILAGIDTTSLTTGFTLYHLAVNERCQGILFQELKRLLPKLNSQITQETLSSCAYLKRVVKESLRMNPISIGVGRVLQTDSIIAGYQIPAGTNCITQGQVICRFPEYFEKPDEFIPERWAPENRKMAKLHPYLLLPFGHGPRACIGRRLAENEMYIIIASIIRNFQIEWKGKPNLDAISTTINKPDGPLLFNFIPRLD